MMSTSHDLTDSDKSALKEEEGSKAYDSTEELDSIRKENKIRPSVLRPSLLRIGEGEQDSEDSNSGSNAKDDKVVHSNPVFNFTPLSNTSGVISSTSELPRIEIACSSHNGVSIKSDKTNATSNITSSLFSNINQSAPLTSSTTTSLNATSNVESPEGDGREGFIFGQNLEERVLITESTSDVSNDGSSEVKELDTKKDFKEASSSSEKRKYEAITGEEDESNVLQMYCKLYHWESDKSSWKEKGKGLLRLNDKFKDDKLCSRLVMRTSGSLKVILNSKLVLGMKTELSSEQCLRFTNVDGIFLIKGKDKDVGQLQTAIEYRLKDMSKRIKTEEKDKNLENKNHEEERIDNSKELRDAVTDDNSTQPN